MLILRGPLHSESCIVHLSFSFFMPFCFLVFAPCVWLPSPLLSPYPLSLFLKCCQARDSLSVHLIFRLDVLKCYGYLHLSVIAFTVIHCIFVAQSILHFLVCRYIISWGYHAMLFLFLTADCYIYLWTVFLFCRFYAVTENLWKVRKLVF